MPGDPREALIALMIVTSAADGDMSDVELAVIRRLCAGLPALAGVTPDQVARLGAGVAERLAQPDGLEALIVEAAGLLPESLCPTAYALCLDVASADRVARPEELRLLDLLRDRLGLDALTVAALERTARARIGVP